MCFSKREGTLALTTYLKKEIIIFKPPRLELAHGKLVLPKYHSNVHSTKQGEPLVVTLDPKSAFSVHYRDP